MMRILSVIGALFLGGAFLTSCTTSGRVSTFVVLPDTQTYLEQCPEVFDSQVDWLVANRKKIDAVFQVGDLTQDNSPVEWAYMQKAFHRVSQAILSYGEITILAVNPVSFRTYITLQWPTSIFLFPAISGRAIGEVVQMERHWITIS